MSDSQPGLSNVIWGLSAVEYRDMSLCWWGVRPESCFHVDTEAEFRTGAFWMIKYQDIDVTSTFASFCCYHFSQLSAAIILYIILGLFAFQFSLVEIAISEASPRLQTILSPSIPIYWVCSKHILKKKKHVFPPEFQIFFGAPSTSIHFLDPFGSFFNILYNSSSVLTIFHVIMFKHLVSSFL